MRVLILNDYAARVGGAEILTYDLREGLRRRGHQAWVLAGDGMGDDADADRTCFGTTSGARTLVRTVNPLAALAVRRAVRDLRPDVVHVRMFLTQLSPLVLPALDGVPALYHAAWYAAVCPTGFKLLPDRTVCHEPAGVACRRCLSRRAWVALMGQRALLERWSHAFSLYVANSDTTRRRLEEGGLSPVVRVWGGVRDCGPRAPLDDPPTIAFAGRLSWEKGADDLVDAFGIVASRVPAARLVILGDGPERAALERRIASHPAGDRIELLGHLPRPEAERVLARAWVQAVPSVVEEPFGLVVAEAMMRGTALVVSDHGGPAELTRAAGAGERVAPGDPKALGEALAALLEDRDRIEEDAVTMRSWARENLTLDRAVDSFETLYERLAEGSFP